MIRPPSNRLPYTDYFSGDPDFDQPVPVQIAGETDDEFTKRTADLWKAYHHAVRVARERGDWSAITKQGGKPTGFVFRLLPGELVRCLSDSMDRIGKSEFASLVFRAAVISADGFDFKFVEHDKLGRIASLTISDAMDSIDFRIVNEFAADIVERAYLRPK